VGLILCSSYLMAAERQGHSVLQILEQIESIFGGIDVGISLITFAELMHGAYRADNDVRKQRRLAFIDRICKEFRSIQSLWKLRGSWVGLKVNSQPRVLPWLLRTSQSASLRCSLALTWPLLM
jgi:hypothetical protein